MADEQLYKPGMNGVHASSREPSKGRRVVARQTNQSNVVHGVPGEARRIASSIGAAPPAQPQAQVQPQVQPQYQAQPQMQQPMQMQMQMQPQPQPVHQPVYQAQPIQQANALNPSAQFNGSQMQPTSMNDLMQTANKVQERENLMSKLDSINQKIEKLNINNSQNADENKIDVKGLFKSEFGEGLNSEELETMDRLSKVIDKNNEKMQESFNKKMKEFGGSGQKSDDFKNELARQIPDWEYISSQDPNFAMFLQSDDDRLNTIKNGMKNHDVNTVKTMVNYYRATAPVQNRPGNVNVGMPQSSYVASQAPANQQVFEDPNSNIVSLQHFENFMDQVAMSPNDPAFANLSSDDLNSFIKENIAYHFGGKNVPLIRG